MSGSTQFVYEILSTVPARDCVASPEIGTLHAEVVLLQLPLPQTNLPTPVLVKPKVEERKLQALVGFATRLGKDSKNLEPDFAKVIEDEFWSLL